MKKIILTIITIFLLTSCKSYLANYYLKTIGVYDKNIKLEKINNNEKEIIFFGMHHIGKEEFYNDVKNKVDSLIKKDYFFYVEGVNSQFSGKTKFSPEDSLIFINIALKFRKISGLPLISKNLNTDYLTLLKEKGINIREKIVKQPKYVELGLSENNSKNTDLSIEQILENYEIKHGKIILDSCDFKTKFYEESICRKKTDKNIYDEMMLRNRNNNIISHILKEKKTKIAIIYGKAHFIGIKDSLQKLGYTKSL